MSKKNKHNPIFSKLAAGPPPQQGMVPPSDRPVVVALLKAIETLRGSRAISYYLTDEASIAPDVTGPMATILGEVGPVEQIDLFIRSRGGQTEVPWQLVQMIRAYCKRFAVLVTERAQSAATHISLGADEIIMTPFAVLGPVDPQRTHPLLPKGAKGENLPISVQDLKHAVEFVKREAGNSGLTGEAFAQVVTALFQQVHPLAVGAIEQSYALSKLITRRMLSTHMDEVKEAVEITAITDALSDNYKSHDFPIGLLEAKRLGLKAKEPDGPLRTGMDNLALHYEGLDRPPGTAQAVDKTGAKVTLGVSVIAHLDSTALRHDCYGFAGKDSQGEPMRGSNWHDVTAPQVAPAAPAPTTAAPGSATRGSA